MSAEQFKEITKIRLEIEGFAVAQAAQNVPPELITELRALNERLSATMEAPGENKAAVVLINKELHFLIYTAANMPMLVKIIESLWLRIGPVLNYDLRARSARTQKKIRSEEHTSELQSLMRISYAVFCLKKNNKT